MNDFSKIILSPIDETLIFGVMSEFRIGGLSPDNISKFLKVVKALKKEFKRMDNQNGEMYDFIATVEPEAAIRNKLFIINHNLSQFNLKPITENDMGLVFERISKRLNDEFKICWHPEASSENCTKDINGTTKISSAHSIQRGKILKKLSESNDVRQFRLNKAEKDLSKPIKRASTFWGFCDFHDKIFNPIEHEHRDYEGTKEQNFLFAYRAFVKTSHIKQIFSRFYDFGLQSKLDIICDKKIFDNAILTNNYSKVCTDTLILDYEYPLAVSSMSDLDFDYFGNSIKHSEKRLEQFYLTIFPENGKTYVLFSYFDEDSDKYENIIPQIKSRNKFESDLSVLIAGHCENVFFKPSYYEQYIRSQEDSISKLVIQTQLDFVPFDGYGKKGSPFSLTPENYLDNEFNIQLFNK